MFKKVLGAVLLVPIVLVLVSLFLPSRYTVERSQLVKGSPESVYSFISTLKRWPEWTAWTAERYPDMKISYAGPESGVGASYMWEGKSSGAGALKLTSADPQKGIRYELEFEHGKYLCVGAISLRPVEDSVEVTWTNQGELGRNPVSRYFGLFMDKMMGPDMETGLRNLQKKVETK